MEDSDFKLHVGGPNDSDLRNTNGDEELERALQNLKIHQDQWQYYRNSFKLKFFLKLKSISMGMKKWITQAKNDSNRRIRPRSPFYEKKLK